MLQETATDAPVDTPAVPPGLPNLFAVVIHPGPDEPDAEPRIVRVAEHSIASEVQAGFNDCRRDGRNAVLCPVDWHLAGTTPSTSCSSPADAPTTPEASASPRVAIFGARCGQSVANGA